MSGVSHRLQDFTLLFIIATTIGTVLRGFFKQLVIVLAHDLTQHASLDVVSHALRKMMHFRYLKRPALVPIRLEQVVSNLLILGIQKVHPVIIAIVHVGHHVLLN